MPFKPGNNANPAGRPKGSKHALQEGFLRKLVADFEQFGVEAIVATRKENPVKYLEIIAGLMPKEAKVEHSGEIEHSIREVALSRVDEILAGIDYGGRVVGGEPEALPN